MMEIYSSIHKNQIEKIKSKVKEIMGRKAFILKSKEDLNQALSMIGRNIQIS